MRLEDNWRKQVHNSNYEDVKNKSNYIKDKSLKEESSILAKVLSVSAVFLAGKKAYNKGYFSNIAYDVIDHLGTNGIKDFDKYTPTREFVSNSIKKVQKSLPELNSVYQKTKYQGLRKSSDELGVVLKDIVDDFKDDFSNFKGTKDTQKDLFTLTNTEFQDYIHQMNETIESLATKDETFNNQARDKMLDSLVEKLDLTPEEIIDDYNKTKTTKVTLNDIVEVKKSKKEVEDMVRGGTFEKEVFELTSKRDDFKLSDEALMNLRALLNNKDSKGKRLIEDFDRIKNLKLDNSIRINKNNEIKDLRGAKEKINNVAKVFTQDLQMPFLEFNPLRMIGFDGGIWERKQLFANFGKGTKQHILSDKLNHKGVISKTGEKFKPELAEDFIFIDGNVFGNDNGRLNQVASNMDLIKIKHDPFRKSNPKKADAIRKMMDMKYREFDDYNIQEHGILKTIKGKVMRGLDIGFQDVDPDDVEIKNIMTYFNKLEKLIPQAFSRKRKVNDYNVFGINRSSLKGKGREGFSGFDTYVAVNKSFSFKDLFDKDSEKNIGTFFKELVAGRNNAKDISHRTLNIYHLFERLNSALGSAGLGMNTKNLADTPSVVKNLITKRILPVYASRDAYHYLNMKSEELTGKEIEDKAAEVIVGADIGMAKVREALGIAGFSKNMQPLTPGSEQIGELPVFGGLINAFIGSDTSEEREDFWKDGEVAVRKGRWWSLGNTAFTGGKTEYYSPNWYRRIKADSQFTDSKYGSKKEYLKYNTWLPNPENKLGLNNILFPEDQYHYEMKHYYERPYLQTGGAFDNVPMVGPILQKTVGQFIKPKKKMHLDYWNKYSVEDIEKDRLVSDMIKQKNMEQKIAQEKEMQLRKEQMTHKQLIQEKIKEKDYENALKLLKVYPREDIMKAQIDAKHIVNFNKNQKIPLIRTDNGKIVEYTDNFINTKGKVSRDYIGGKASRYNPSVNSLPLYKDENNELITPNQRIIVPEDYNSIGNSASILKDKLAELTGIYGYGAETLASKKSFRNKFVIETPSYEMSLNDSFWDKSLGGFGGEISEIYRRFFNKKPRLDYFNPIKNTQEDWMPGDEYFKDFKHGDPYSKVKQGEMRIAGAGYEAMHGNSGIFDMPFSISDMTKSPERIAQDYITEEEKPTGYLAFARKRGKQIDSQIKKELSKKGLAKELEVGVRNDKHNIGGKYDVRVVDLNSRQKEAPLEIKSVSEEAFQEIKGPDYTQIEKMNFVLNEGSFDQGHIMYVNRSNPQERKTFVIKPNKVLHEQTLKKADEARQILVSKLNSGEINKRQIYSPFHKFKILADVAPYSQNFKDYKEIVNRLVLSPEQEREKQEILKQVDTRYDSVRLYDYRFKDTDIKNTKLTVENVLRDGKIMVREFDTPLKLAAVKTELGNDKLYHTLRDNLKKGDKIIVQHGLDNTKIKQDGYLSARVIKDGLLGKKDINRFILNEGIAKEDTEDFSAPALHERFSDSEIAFGKMWEKIAHANTYANTKFMQTRSGLESYKRRDMYGKDFQRWESPIEDFLVPAVNQAIESGSIFKFIGIVGVGTLFGGTAFGQAIGAAALGSWVVGGKLVAKAKEYKTGKKWIPENRKKQMQYREYLDKLKYIKNKRISKLYYDEALKKEGFDIDKFERDKKAYNRYFYRVNRKERSGIKDFFSALWDEEFLSYAKKKFIDGSTRVELNFDDVYNEDLVDFFKEKLMIGINKRKLKKYSKQYAISKKKFYESEYAQKAKEYDDIAEKETMYGYDHYDNIYRLYKAIPKRDRKYIDSFNNATVKEKGEILRIAPKYLRRILQKEWGLPMEQKTNLKQYFKHHALPGQEWIGWNPLMDMDIIKTKLIKNAEMDLAEFNIWDDDVKAANEWGEIALPDIEKKSDAKDIKRRLKKMLSEEEFEEIEIKYDDDDKRDMNINLQITKDQHKAIMKKLMNIREYL